MPGMAIGSAVIALGLSIAQFSPDQRNSARAFLVHRGLSRSQLFHGKLIIGIAIYTLAVWFPILICTLYLEWMGPFRLPTSARQTIPAWVVSVYAFSFYFGGGMVACSTTRWVGTRILPLAVSCLLTICGLSMTLSAPIGLVLLILGFAAFGVYAMYRASQGRGKAESWEREGPRRESSLSRGESRRGRRDRGNGASRRHIPRECRRIVRRSFAWRQQGCC